MIDPEFWSDEGIGVWSHTARLFYIGLWNFADDEGRFKAHNQLLKSQIFPYDNKINIENLKKEVSSKIQWYKTGDSQYGHLRNFLKHQRIDKPQPSKLPIPPPFCEYSQNIQGIVPPNIKEEKRSKEKGADAPNAGIYPFLKNKDFESLWISWLEVRKQKKIPNTLRAQELALSKLHAWGEDKAKEALRQAIEKGWRGVFEPKDDPKDKVIYV